MWYFQIQTDKIVGVNHHDIVVLQQSQEQQLRSLYKSTQF